MNFKNAEPKSGSYNYGNCFKKVTNCKDVPQIPNDSKNIAKIVLSEYSQMPKT